MNLVSIITPVFNRADELSKTIKSVLDQTYSNWELILVDDGSADESIKIAEAFAQKYSRVISIQRDVKPKGASTCRNIGIEMAKGDYIMFLDSDDLLASDCLFKRLDRMENNPKLDFTVNQTGLFNSKTRQVEKLWSSLDHKNDIQAFIDFEGWCISSTFFKTSFIKNYRFDEKASCLQDWGLHVRVLLDKPKYKKFPNSQPDVFIRTGHGNRISQTNTSPERITSRFEVLLGLESEINEKSQGSGNFLKQFFQPLEYAAVEFSNEQFQRLFQIWQGSISYNPIECRGLIRFLKIQNIFKRLKIRFINALLFRVSRRLISKDLVGPLKRSVLLDKPLRIHE